MAHEERESGSPRMETQLPSLMRYASQPESHHSLKLEPSTSRSSNGETQTLKPYAYSPSHDPSLQLPPIKSIEGYTPTLPHLPRPPAPSDYENGQQHQEPHRHHHSTSHSTPYRSPPSDMRQTSGQMSATPQSQPVTSPSDQSLSGDKHRKEIKRRTKTGCLTCRKRRIKCDESHPVCRNCQKSKRECQGYEPLFRPASKPYLPHTSSSVESSSSSHTTIGPDTSPYNPAPHGYAPIAPPRYAQFPAPVPYQPGATMNPNYAHHHPTPDGSTSAEASRSTSSSRQYGPSGTSSNGQPTVASNSHPPRPATGQNTTARRPLTIPDLYTVGAGEPPTPRFSQPMSAEVMDQIRYMYMTEYGRGIDGFLESTWYTTEGVDFFLRDSTLCEHFAGVLESFQKTKSDNYDAMRLLPFAESRLTWRLMCLARDAAGPQYPPRLSSQSSSSSHPSASNNSTPMATNGPTPPLPSTLSPSHRMVLDRLDIFEHLITGRTLPNNPLSGSIAERESHAYPPHSPDIRRLEFWREVGNHISLSPTATTEIDASLSRLRLLLDMIENRDVLYSIAIVRRYGPGLEALNTPSSDPNLSPAVRDEQVAKLRVAKKFVEDEAAGRGTTQVAQRLCGMAVRSWAHWGSYR